MAIITTRAFDEDADFGHLSGRRPNIVDLLRQDDPESDFDFEFPRSAFTLREIDL